MTEPIVSEPHKLATTFNFWVTLRRSPGGTAAVSSASAPDPASAAGGGTTSGAGSQAADGETAPAPADQDMLGDGGFQEVSGLEIEVDVEEHLEGGRNDGVVRMLGRGKYTNLVLKRGMFFGEGGRIKPEFWTWVQDLLEGRRPVVRYDGIVELFDPSGREVRATWRFSRGLPVKITGPNLDAKSGDVAIEELHIAHEGLALEANP